MHTKSKSEEVNAVQNCKHQDYRSNAMPYSKKPILLMSSQHTHARKLVNLWVKVELLVHPVLLV